MPEYNCEEHLVWNVDFSKASSMDLYSILQAVTTENYENMKAEFGAVIPEYLASGDFSGFSESREMLRQKIENYGINTAESFTYKHSLANDSLAEYSQCLANHSTNLISTWIESYLPDYPDGRPGGIKIGVKVEGRATDKIRITISGTHQHGPLSATANSREFLSFPTYSIYQNFSITIRAAVGDYVYSESIDIPRKRKFKFDPIIGRELGIEVEGHAKANGDDTIIRGGSLKADSGFYIHHWYQTYPDRMVGPGASMEVDVIPNGVGDQCTELQFVPNDVTGTSQNTQGGAIRHYTVLQRKDRYREL